MSRQVLDLVGEICPVPLLRTQEATAALPPGSQLVVLTDYARAVRTITEWCVRKEYPYIIGDQRGGVWKIVIRPD